MARSRRLDKRLVEVLLPRITSHMVYLTSAHLAMLSSAIAKAEVHDAKFVAALTRELKARLMEFSSAMEVTMVINSASKLRVTDESLYRRLVTHIQGRMVHEQFHVRDLSVILGALARVHCTDPNMVTEFAETALQTLPDATSPELARLMHACMSVSYSQEDLFRACVQHFRQLSRHMDPAALSSAAFAFGQCFEAAGLEHVLYLRSVFRTIRIATVANLPLYMPRELVGLLRTYARWQIGFDCDHLRKVADRMTSLASKFDEEGAVSALYSLSLLMQRNAARTLDAPSSVVAWEAAGEAARRLLTSVWDKIRDANAGEVDAILVIRAVEASTALQANDPKMLPALSACIAQRRIQLDGPARSSLYELLSQYGCSPEEDVMLVIADGLTASPLSRAHVPPSVA